MFPVSNLCNRLIVNILFDAKVIDDKVLTLEGIGTHIELQQIADRIILGKSNFIQTDILANKFLELVGIDLTQTLKAGNLGSSTALLDSALTLLLRITIEILFLVLHAEQWRLQNVKVAAADKLGIELQEEAGHKQADVHTINIGIGCNNHLIVTQILQSILDKFEIDTETAAADLDEFLGQLRTNGFLID